MNYFGTSVPQYELGERFIPWRSALGPYPGWLAVSATTLHLAQGQWDPAHRQKPEEAYAWLRGQSPTAKIGYSIWVFDLRPSRGAFPAPPTPRHPNMGGGVIALVTAAMEPRRARRPDASPNVAHTPESQGHGPASRADATHAAGRMIEHDSPHVTMTPHPLHRLGMKPTLR